jgi:hypothetical protein
MSHLLGQTLLLEDIAVDTFVQSSFGTVVMTLFQGLFTAPSWQAFTYLACGWALADDRHTITTYLWLTGATTVKHFSRFYVFLGGPFYTRRWQLWGALTVGRLLAVPLVLRVTPSTIVLGDLMGCLVSVGIMMLSAHSVVAHWLGTGGLGLFMASIFPTTLVFAERRLVMTGRVTGWFLVGASVGAMSLPWLMGQLFELMGPRVLLSTIMAALMVATGVFGIVMRCSTRPACDVP